MALPTQKIPVVNLDNAGDSITQAREDLYASVQAVNDIIDGIDANGGLLQLDENGHIQIKNYKDVPILGSNGKINIDQIPIGEGLEKGQDGNLQHAKIATRAIAQAGVGEAVVGISFDRNGHFISAEIKKVATTRTYTNYLYTNWFDSQQKAYASISGIIYFNATVEDRRVDTGRYGSRSERGPKGTITYTRYKIFRTEYRVKYRKEKTT